MAITDQVTSSYTGQGSTYLQNTIQSFTGDASFSYIGTISQMSNHDAGSSAEIDASIGHTSLVSMLIFSTAPVTILTNSSGSPVDVLVIAANDPFIYRKTTSTVNISAGGAVSANLIPFGTDVTKFFVYVTSGTADAILTIRANYTSGGTP